MTQRQDERFVWNDEQPEVVEVQAVEVVEGFIVQLRFSDGSEREIDLEPYLHGPVFQPLRNDLEMFRRMHIEGGTIAWENGADIAPETLYEDSHPARVKHGKKAALRSTRRAHS